MYKKIIYFLLLFFLFPLLSFAVEQINATFDDINDFTTYHPVVFIPGESVPTADNASDRPRTISADASVTVENNATVSGTTLLTNNFMQILDNNSTDDGYAIFDLTDTEYGTGIVKISWDMLIKGQGEYYFKFTNQRGNLTSGLYSTTLASIVFNNKGEISYSNYNTIGTYNINTPIHYECYLNLDNNTWAVVKNGEVIFNDVSITDSPFAAFIMGFKKDDSSTANLEIDNVKIVHNGPIDWWPTPNTNCPTGLPDPILKLTETNNVIIGGSTLLRYRFKVLNYFYYPDSLFAANSSLPPCGANANSSRTWVDFYNQNDNYLYGFCSLGQSKGLNDIWVDNITVQRDNSTSVKIKMNDRLCNRTYTSNSVSVSPDLFATLTLNVSGPGKVMTNDLFYCKNDNLSGSTTCTLTYLKGQTVKLYPYPESTSTMNSQFLGWSGVNCPDNGTCSFIFTDNTTIDANFAATGTPVVWPVPSSQLKFIYGLTATPILSSIPANSKPFAVGDLSSGNIRFQVSFPDFQNDVDIYLAIMLPSGTLLILDEHNMLHDISTLTTLPKWKPAHRNQFSWVVPDIPLTNIPKGRYILLLAVTPANSTSNFYIWQTSFDNN